MKYINYSVFKNFLKKLLLIILCILPINYTHSQIKNQTFSQKESDPNEHIKSINRKLKVLSSPSPDVVGGYVRNNSYEGVKGGPYLFDDFKTLLFKTKEINYYISVEANIDLKTNSVLYKIQEDDQLYSIPVTRMAEVIYENENSPVILKTTEGKTFEPGLDGIRFYQVIKDGPKEFIKIPYKIFIPADYTGAYTAKRRYDEYKIEFAYYLLNSDKIYKKVLLTKRSLIKAFPENRKQIKDSFKLKTNNKEEVVIDFLDKI